MLHCWVRHADRSSKRSLQISRSGPAPPPPSGGGNIGDLVTWANDNCAQSQGWECAEFAARAIAAGGFIPGLRYAYCDNMQYRRCVASTHSVRSPDDSTYTYASWCVFDLLRAYTHAVDQEWLQSPHRA